MSILLSLITNRGIVFAADKNMTELSTQGMYIVESALTKVLMWPKRRAAIGFIGLAEIEGLLMDEWLRIFIAETRNFEQLWKVAKDLCDKLEEAFAAKPLPRSMSDGLMIHLAGFEDFNGVSVPVMYIVTNFEGLTDSGGYTSVLGYFKVTEDIRDKIINAKLLYPSQVAKYFERNNFIWFVNGARYDAFNVFKDTLLPAFKEVHRKLKKGSSFDLKNWEAYAKIAVDLYGSYFKYELPPSDRVVGGGVDTVTIPWN